MPAEGIPLISHQEILSFEEMERLITLFAQMGVTKVRITGGEPFVRKGIVQLLKTVRDIDGINSLHLTTNGVNISQFISELEALPVDGINFSLDTLQTDRFYQITYKNFFTAVYEGLQKLLESKIPLKINTVIQSGVNTNEIVTIAELAQSHPVEVRFIEQMPFNGKGNSNGSSWNIQKILAKLKSKFANMEELPENGSTAIRYKIPGFIGQLGIIPGYSRYFCSSCNRIRVTPAGRLKSCLYDSGVLDLKYLLRSRVSDDTIKEKIIEAVAKRAKNGFESESRNYNKKFSMAVIGG
jgi:cyclic pyranopterin phosphate synthase